MQLASGTNVDRYVVEGLLGRGGMAVVYKVRHKQLGSVHALKVLLLQAPGIQARLLQEGRAQSGFRHGNVVAVTDIVEIAGCPAIVLEYVDGPPLDAFLASVRPTLEQADLLARGILRGMAAAHQQGLVHRDLKPGNVLLAIQADEIVPKINDFGLAKVVGDGEPGGQRTRTGATMGTPAYMAPEQIRDAAHVDGRADVWAAGAVLYELVCGRRVFDGADTLAVMNAVASGRFAPPRELVPDLPERMERAILGALVVDPAARIASMEALLEVWRGDVAPPVPHITWGPEVRGRTHSLRSQPEQLPTSGETYGAADRSIGATTPAVDLSLPAPEPTLGAGTSANTSRPALARSWPRVFGAFAVGTLVGLPFLFGDIGLLFDDPVAALADGGPFVKLVLLVSAAGIGAIAALALEEREGRPQVVPWIVVPGVLTAIGSVGTLFATYIVRSRLPVTDLDARAAAAAQGISEALVNTVAASAFGCSLFLTAAIALVWANASRVERDTVPPRAFLTVGAGLLAGVVGWVAHPHLSGVPGLSAFEVFPAFLVMACAVGAIAVLASDAGRPETLRARLLTLVCGAYAVAHAARTVDARHVMRANAAFSDAERIAGDLTYAETVLPTIGRIASSPGLFWAALFVVASFPAFAWKRPDFGFPYTVVLAAFGTLVAVGPLKLFADHEVGALAAEILPGEVRSASRWHLGVEVVDTPAGIVVDAAPVGHPLEAGDRIVSVNEHVFDDASGLLHALWDCRCPAACSLGSTCFGSGSTVSITVARAGELATVVVPLASGGR